MEERNGKNEFLEQITHEVIGILQDDCDRRPEGEDNELTGLDDHFASTGEIFLVGRQIDASGRHRLYKLTIQEL